MPEGLPDLRPERGWVRVGTLGGSGEERSAHMGERKPQKKRGKPKRREFFFFLGGGWHFFLFSEIFHLKETFFFGWGWQKTRFLVGFRDHRLFFHGLGRLLRVTKSFFLKVFFAFLGGLFLRSSGATSQNRSQQTPKAPPVSRLGP